MIGTLRASTDMASCIACDPVCGMSVDIVTATHQLHHNGDRVHFCSNGCLEKFVTDPWLYTSGRYQQLKDHSSAVMSLSSVSVITNSLRLRSVGLVIL